MRKLILTATIFIAGCTAEFKEQGVMTCTSNIGRDILVWHTSTGTPVINVGGESSLSFTTLDGVKYTLYTIKDSDYNCELTTPDKT